MIQIEDDDLPITVAQKIITAVRPHTPLPVKQSITFHPDGRREGGVHVGYV